MPIRTNVVSLRGSGLLTAQAEHAARGLEGGSLDPDSPPSSKPPYRQSRQDRVQAREEGATALAPPEAPVCPECGLEADRFPTLSQAWMLLEPLEPEHVVAAHLVPPRHRWVINSDGVAWNLWMAEPLTRTVSADIDEADRRHADAPADPGWDSPARRYNSVSHQPEHTRPDGTAEAERNPAGSANNQAGRRRWPARQGAG
ncbi:DUF6083 domain-containing protein [Streptomyces sp. NPDC007896]|uniref:DUF6083 domain-containing protein n=1 Tax=Streptomyces sp. NPDC007896 TaxID=3364784 RepID=UPI0036EAFF13